MAEDGTVNSQITDSVTQIVALLTGLSPSQSMGMLDAVLLDTLGMAMHNAVSRQQNSHMASQAAVTAACARMLQVQPPAPPKPLPPPAPVVQPLPPPKTDLAADIAADATTAELGVTRLQTDATTAGQDAEAATAALKKIADLASPAQPTPAPPTPGLPTPATPAPAPAPPAPVTPAPLPSVPPPPSKASE